MNRRVCSDNAPIGRRETSVSNCYRRGKKSGYYAGILQGIENANENVRRKKKAIEASSQAIVFKKFKQIPVARATNDLRKATLSILRVPNYRALSEAQTIVELRNRGITKLMIPRT